MSTSAPHPTSPTASSSGAGNPARRKASPSCPRPPNPCSRAGLIEIRPARIGYAAFLTDSGLAALRLLVLDARAMDPARFGHLREQLGLQAPE